MKTTLALVVASLIVFSLGSACAGEKDPAQVMVTTYWSSGSVGSARNSADTTQYIGCQMVIWNGSVSFECFARNASGAWGSCYSSNPAFFPVVQSIGPSSFIAWDNDANGNCTQLNVYNSSLYAPPQP
jgi:hypothetical protein